MLRQARSACQRALAATRCVSGRSVLASASVSRPFSSTDSAEDSDSSDAPRFPLTSLTFDEELLRSNVSRWARKELAPRVAQMDRDAVMAPEVLQGLFDQGLMGIEIPVEYGGSGMDLMASVLAIEELAKTDPAVSVCMDVHNTLTVNSIVKWGSKEQKERYLPRLATDTLGAFCISEAGSGSDAFSLAARAEPDGEDHFVLSGTKMWITNAKEAGLFMIMANADPSRGYKGITAFLVERDTPGIEIGPSEDKLGIRASSTCPVHLNNVRVSRDAVLGDIGKGYRYAIEILNVGRIGIGAQMLGLAQGCYDATMPYLFQRRQFGQLIGEFQAMQMQYADAATEIAAARLLVYNAARLAILGKPFVMEAAMAKLQASRVAEAVASKSIEWLGGVGFTKEMPAEKYYRDSKVGQIYEGTSIMQLQTIARLLQLHYA